MQSRDQKFSKDVWDKIPNHSIGSKEAKDYGGWAQQLPVLIRTAGLAQALAFAHSKTDANTQERLMLDDFAQVVLENPQTNVGTLAERVRARDTSLLEYMRLTRRSLEVCVWFKRFVESKLDVKPGEEGQE